MKDKLKFVKITKENIDLATEFQMSIFSSECGYKHFLISLGSQYEYFSYYLVYLESTLIGITGIYSFEPVEETNSLWLGWFGIEEKHRRLGYGKEVLLKTFDMVKYYAKKDSNIKYFRLYTSSTQNPIACNLYREIMDIEEEYNCPNDYNYEGTCLIFSKVIDSKYPMEKWNNRFLNLNRIIEQEIVGDLEYKKKKKGELIKASTEWYAGSWVKLTCAKGTKIPASGIKKAQANACVILIGGHGGNWTRVHISYKNLST